MHKKPVIQLIITLFLINFLNCLSIINTTLELIVNRYFYPVPKPAKTIKKHGRLININRFRFIQLSELQFLSILRRLRKQLFFRLLFLTIGTFFLIPLPWRLSFD